MRSLFLIILFILPPLVLSAQDDKVRLAFQYYQEKEFQKAAVLFQELFEQSNAQVYFTYAINCLIEIKEYSEAEKLIKKQIRRNKSDLNTYIEYGFLYKKQGNETEALKQFDHVLKNLNPDRNQIVSLANNFVMKREYDWALQVYQKGGKLAKHGFELEIANVYAFQRKSQEMVDIYLDLLKTDPGKTEFIQNNLQARMSSSFDDNLTDILQKSLIRRIQKEPRDIIYSEMLLWFYIQQSDFVNAIIQAKALDKRLNEGGMRLIELGNMARTNGLFSEAKDAYEYVMLRGKEAGFYFDARLGYLEVLSEQVELGHITEKDEFVRLEKTYHETIKEFGDLPQTIRLIKDLAHLMAFHLNKTEEAKNLVKEAIHSRKLEPMVHGACKTELGDIYLLNGQASDAILEYAQAAKSNENNEIGDNAKFKRATLAFYTGNFQWAQAQLDVLKTATSKLIANDAFELSMLIKDNLGTDTSETALVLFARAEMLLKQKKPVEALLILDSIEIHYRTHSLIDDVLFLKARIYEKQGKLEKATAYLEQIADNYGSGLLGDDAIYKLAQIYDYQLNDKEKAMAFYKRIIFDYTGSIFVVDSRKRFRILRGENIPQS